MKKMMASCGRAATRRRRIRHRQSRRVREGETPFECAKLFPGPVPVRFVHLRHASHHIDLSKTRVDLHRDVNCGGQGHRCHDARRHRLGRRALSLVKYEWHSRKEPTAVCGHEIPNRWRRRDDNVEGLLCIPSPQKIMHSCLVLRIPESCEFQVFAVVVDTVSQPLRQNFSKDVVITIEFGASRRVRWRASTAF